ncbi:MAG: hypothetical protein MZV63_63630 [Marinilabiliales bacterium]|nr:hypothetical protein [Marinilabiliales bacterium]
MDSAVLAVDGENFHAVSFRVLENDLSSHHDRFFVGEGDSPGVCDRVEGGRSPALPTIADTTISEGTKGVSSKGRYRVEVVLRNDSSSFRWLGFSIDANSGLNARICFFNSRDVVTPGDEPRRKPIGVIGDHPESAFPYRSRRAEDMDALCHSFIAECGVIVQKRGTSGQGNPRDRGFRRAPESGRRWLLIPATTPPLRFDEIP